jgi:hypothetical protein
MGVLVPGPLDVNIGLNDVGLGVLGAGSGAIIIWAIAGWSVGVCWPATTGDKEDAGAVVPLGAGVGALNWFSVGRKVGLHVVIGGNNYGAAIISRVVKTGGCGAAVGAGNSGGIAI